MITKNAFLAVLFLVAPICLSAEPNPKIIAKLEEIVKIEEGRLAREKRLQMEARRTGDQIAEIQMDVCEAKINLARERAQPEVVVEQLKQILSLQQFLYKDAEIRYQLGNVDSDELSKWKVKILATEIRLIRVGG